VSIFTLNIDDIGRASKGESAIDRYGKTCVDS